MEIKRKLSNLQVLRPTMGNVLRLAGECLGVKTADSGKLHLSLKIKSN